MSSQPRVVCRVLYTLTSATPRRSLGIADYYNRPRGVAVADAEAVAATAGACGEELLGMR